ncbi:hypothetical protein HHK36_007266 [Tetracentron sinense]|uniref:Pentatricopeptide repeat-containing protein n=1 Tax=Tetracentron sinense TaxID=13715 RepID=A0A835DL30_TETSI|nr:hypothetical protein HHK36_007266 [Tetracentron sinense]
MVVMIKAGWEFSVSLMIVLQERRFDYLNRALCSSLTCVLGSKSKTWIWKNGKVLATEEFPEVIPMEAGLSSGRSFVKIINALPFLIKFQPQVPDNLGFEVLPSTFLKLWGAIPSCLQGKVCYLISQVLSFPINFSLKTQLKLLNTSHRFLFHSSVEKPILSSGGEINGTHKDLTTIGGSGIGRSVILRCSYLWEKKGETFAQDSLQDLLFKLSDISPETTRRFRRVSGLKPENVLEILLGFEFDCGKSALEARKVEYLWKLFKWASNQSKDFEHLPQSYKVMAWMLTRVGLLGEAESLVWRMEAQGILLDDHEIFSKIVEGYASGRDLDNSISMYNQMRARGLVMSRSCYHIYLNLLVQMNKTLLAFRFCMDMVEVGFIWNNEENTTFEHVLRLLCRDGKIQEARNLVKKVVASGLEPSSIVLNTIANGYCEKKDFEDLLSFLIERNCAPDAPVCNKIIASQCRNFGAERAYIFMQKLESLGFRPDEITFGILIGWSCREGLLKNAFIYLSELLSRCLKPNIISYNSLISGVFKEGMWEHARDILDEIVDRGVTPNVSTFRVLIAGYCKGRRFDEAKMIVGEMVNHGWTQLSPSEDQLSKAFMVLGFDPFAVKVKRDNMVGISNTEFFDSLGNGLYLETDLDMYEKTVTGVIEDSMIPDFNQLVLKECGHGNLETALTVIDEMGRWGQQLSLSSFSALIRGICISHRHIKAAINLLEEMPEQVDQLDQETLNLLVQAISKKGFAYNGKIILDRMLQRYLPVENETFTALVMGLCKNGNLRVFHECWDLARRFKWLPRLKECKAIVGRLCQQGMIKEALELLESMLETYPHLISDICDVFLEELCVMGFTSIGHVLVEEVLRQGWVLDHTAYSHLIRGFCKEKRFSEAFGIFDTMPHKNMTPCVDVASLLIPQLCRFHRLENVIALKEIMLREQPSISLSVYNALVKGLYKTGKAGDALAQFQEMLVKGVLPDTETYNVMVQGYCQVNNLKKVEELLGIMIRNNFNLSILSYRNMVCLMCMEGRVLQALSVKELMLRETNSPYLVIYNILIFHLFQTQNNLLVTTLLGEMHEKGLTLDEVTHNFLVNGYYKCKDVSSSVEALNTMIGKDLRPSNRSLRMVISHLCRDGELDKALELSRVLELKGWVHGSVVQNAIVEGLLSHGRLREAEILLDRVVEKGLIPNCISYDILIKRFCWQGRLNRAVDLLNIMLKKGNIPSPTSYDSIIKCLCVCKAVDQAINFHSEMLDRNLEPNIDTWDVLVCSLCEDGRTMEAEKLLDSMLQTGQTPTRNMYCYVIDRYRFENNLNKASEILQEMQRNSYVPDFETHWSLISNLSNSNNNDSNNNSGGFLSRLLSQSGFTRTKDSKDLCIFMLAGLYTKNLGSLSRHSWSVVTGPDLVLYPLTCEAKEIGPDGKRFSLITQQPRQLVKFQAVEDYLRALHRLSLIELRNERLVLGLFMNSWIQIGSKSLRTYASEEG